MRTFLLLAVLFLFSCQKEIENDALAPKPFVPVFYYKATIDGHPYSQAVTDSNHIVAGSAVVGQNSVAFAADIAPGTTPYPDTATALRITKGLFSNYATSTDAQFKTFFAPGSYNLAAGPPTNPFANGDGVVIEWVDEFGITWSTVRSPGNQTGSKFAILSTRAAPDSMGQLYLQVKMQFNCQLYNGSGDAMELTDGEMVGLFGKR